MAKWYIVKKKTDTRWTAYKLDSKPILKRGYEMKGPYENLAECLVKSNEEKVTK